MQRPHNPFQTSNRAAGSIAVWMLLLMIPLLGVVALAVDTGAYMARAGKIQDLADEAALAGARELSRIYEAQDPALLKSGSDDQYRLTSAGLQRVDQVARSVLDGGRLSPTTTANVDVGRWQTRTNGTYRYAPGLDKYSNAVQVTVAESGMQPILGRMFGASAVPMRATGTAALTQVERLAADQNGMPFAVSQAWITRQNRQKDPALQYSVIGPNDDYQCLAINTYELHDNVDTASRNYHDISCLLKGGDSGGCTFLGWVTGNDYDSPREFICSQSRISDLERIVCSFWGIGQGARWRSPAAQTIFTDPPPGEHRRTCDGDDTIECVHTQELHTYIDQMNDQVCKDRCGGQNCGDPCCQYEGIWEAGCYSSGVIPFLEDVFDSIDSLSHSDAKIERSMWDNFIMTELASYMKDGSGMERPRLDAAVKQCPDVQIDGRTVPGEIRNAYGKCHHELDAADTYENLDLSIPFWGEDYTQGRILVELVRLYGDYTEVLPVYEDTSGGGKCQVTDGEVPIVGFARLNLDEMSFVRVSEQERSRHCDYDRWYCQVHGCPLDCDGWSAWGTKGGTVPYRQFRDVKVSLAEGFGGKNPSDDRQTFSPNARLRGTYQLAPKLVD